MPKATGKGGILDPLPDCYISIPDAATIRFNNLPDISDSKAAQYNDEPIIGRSTPVKTYSHSAARQITMTLHFFVTQADDVRNNLEYLRALESAVYPREGNSSSPFIPPPVCKLKCGWLLSVEEICAILLSYSVKFPTDVAWDADLMTPYKFDVDTTWEVVYKSSELPGQNRIYYTGR